MSSCSVRRGSSLGAARRQALTALLLTWACALLLVTHADAHATTTTPATASYGYDRAAPSAQSARASVRRLSGPDARPDRDWRGAAATSPRFADLLAAEEALAAGEGSIAPDLVRFSQSSVSGRFSSGGSIDELAKGLRSGAVKPGDVPAIRVVERDGQLYTLDNRRLVAFQKAGVKVPYRVVTPEEAAAEGWKFTTTNGGTSIRIRGGGGVWSP